MTEKIDSEMTIEQLHICILYKSGPYGQRPNLTPYKSGPSVSVLHVHMYNPSCVQHTVVVVLDLITQAGISLTFFSG